MAERPILFSGEMVRAILAGRKSQTRRPVKLEDFKRSDTRGYDWAFRDRGSLWNDVTTVRLLERWCPYGQPGDKLWARETWRSSASDPRHIHYAADASAYERDEKGPWRPSIHMPRWASRLTLTVTDVRVQRVQDVTEEDAEAEGVQSFFERFTAIGRDQCITSGERAIDAPYRASFACTWDDLHERVPAASWKANPWVWCVSFRREESA